MHLPYPAKVNTRRNIRYRKDQKKKRAKLVMTRYPGGIRPAICLAVLSRMPRSSLSLIPATSPTVILSSI
ncbi:MAG: hypothetical protein COZ70_14175 [Deltaproteobacteria bacterium CG_4_8_14_3_um_filter_51_11]|nr:MAG: hypothetical protein COZ70_14175 [Deltaproteobacteria bacterium CG_4_8_14_3_um_filter_51_11]PIY25019.1 MAG: hypothetical protein COZ11_06325 [Deltaproteobacteria bacterium CG_4_10_14_3_um_filter_51_14]